MDDWPSDVRTILVNYSAGRIPFDITSSSTCASILSVVAKDETGKQQTIFVSGYQNELDIGRQLMSVKITGYQVVPGTARISCSIHQDRLTKAKKILIEEILPAELPSPSDITGLIEACGVALNRQIDCDKRIFGKPQYKSPDLSKKLLALGLDQGKTSRLYDKYKDLQGYYNAARHFQRQGNVDALRNLPLFSRSATEIPQPKVDAAYAQQLAGATESEILDYKTDLPFASKPPLVARSELLKDIMAIANTVRDQPGHLFYGRNPGKGLCSITTKVDDADVQQWSENAIEPPMLFSVHTVQLSGFEICLIVIRPASHRPHAARATICKDGPLHGGRKRFPVADTTETAAH